MLSILTQFLSNRSHHVMVDGCGSKLFDVVSGVPQGSVLGTLLLGTNLHLLKVSEWCYLWGIKLNASNTKTMIVSRSRTMFSQSPALTIGGTVLKESDDLVILGAKHLRSVSRAASQRLGILRKSWQLFHDRLLLGRYFSGFVLPVF